MRGFVMLVVLCILSLIGVLVMTQLAIAGTQVVGDVRQVEEERARGAAEACLTLLQAYANDYMAALEGTAERLSPTERAATFFDFDGLLDPNSDPHDSTRNRNDGDEHIPPFTPPVYVPPTANDAAHRWGIIDLGQSARCLVRLEDNSDDGFFGRAASYSTDHAYTWDPARDEGCDLLTENGAEVRCPGLEITDRDNDGAIVLNAIGLYPVPPATAANAAYAQAHARVSIRRLTARAQNENQWGELLNATDEVEMVRTELCGLGGVNTKEFRMDNASCACGDLRAIDYTPQDPVETGCNCAAACNATTKNPLATDPPAYDVGAWVQLGYVPPVLDRTSYPELVVPDVCSLYVRNGMTYLFDTTDANARTQGGVAVTCDTNARCVDRCGEITDDYIAPGFGAPCTWDPVGRTVSCGPGESPCWKPIAAWGAGAPASLWLTPVPAGAHGNWSSGPGELAFYAGEAIPNVKNAARVLGGNTPMCGARDACTDCDGTRPMFTQTATQLATADGLSDARMPVPMSLFVDDPSTRVLIRRTNQQVSGQQARLRMSLITNAPVAIEPRVSLTCASCGWEPQPDPAECYVQQFDFFAFGPAVMSNKDCRVESDGFISGDIDCRTVDLRGDTCINGGIYALAGDLDCGGQRSGVCVRGNDVRISEFVETTGNVIVLPGDTVEFEVGVSASGSVRVRDRNLRLGASIDSGEEIQLLRLGPIVVTEALGGFTIKKQLTYTETTW